MCSPKANLDENGDPPALGADMVFAVMGLSSCLMRMGWILPTWIQTISESYVSIERIRDFLILPDKKRSRLLEDAPPGPRAAIGSVTDLSARYEARHKPVMPVNHISSS